MSYKSDYDQHFDLIPQISSSYVYYSIQNKIQFYTGKIIELSSFIFISAGHFLEYYNIEKKAYIQFTDNTENNQFGLTTISLTQASKQYT